MKFIIRKILIIIIIALLLSLIIDYCLVMLRDTEPLFILKDNNNIKYGLLYKIVYEDDKKSFYIFNFKIKEKKVNNITFIDHGTKECVNDEEILWEDENYYYIFSCQHDYYVKIANNEYSLKTALSNKLINIDSLKEEGIVFTKKAKS